MHITGLGQIMTIKIQSFFQKPMMYKMYMNGHE